MGLSRPDGDLAERPDPSGPSRAPYAPPFCGQDRESTLAFFRARLLRALLPPPRPAQPPRLEDLPLGTVGLSRKCQADGFTGPAPPPAPLRLLRGLLLLALSATELLLPAAEAPASIRVIVEHRQETDGPAFRFDRVPAPTNRDTATRAAFRLVQGEPDDNSAPLSTLQDGRLPDQADQPEANFFFAAGSHGGRILVDFGAATPFRYIATYPRHPDIRGPQLYQLYGATGTEPGLILPPSEGRSPAESGWSLIASVDTRPRTGPGGGQYGVLITNDSGNLGPFRYLLFDIRPTETRSPFGHTFYSEIDAVSAEPDFVPEPPTPRRGPAPFTVRTPDGRFAFTLDLSEAPELESWAREHLVPVLLEWYPKLVEQLPSENYRPPDHVHIVLRPGRGVAAASGSRITANATWIQRELQGEALGALVHELVHVVQQYGQRPPGSSRPPGWLVEGIADYLRWFVYEPHRHGADLVWLRRQRNLQLRHDAGYRISANFLDWVSRRHDPELVRHLNAALREGRYDETLWTQRTGHSLQALADQWRRETEQALVQP